MEIINYINQKWRVFFTLAISLMMFSVGYSQDPGWGDDYSTVPFDNEFSATISAAQVFIDGVEQTGGQLAAFGEDGEISAWDGDGATFFPPGGTNVYELSVWSNYAGEYSVVWNAQNYSSGIYFVGMESNGSYFTQKLMLVK